MTDICRHVNILSSEITTSFTRFQWNFEFNLCDSQSLYMHKYSGFGRAGYMVRYNDKPIDAAMYQRCGFWGRGWEQNIVSWKYNSNTAGWNIRRILTFTYLKNYLKIIRNKVKYNQSRIWDQTIFTTWKNNFKKHLQCTHFFGIKYEYLLFLYIKLMHGNNCIV